MTGRAPETIEIKSGGGSVVYRRDPRLTCIPETPGVPAGATRWSLPDGLVVVEGTAPPGSRPVYRIGDGPLPFVPTGRLFVRLPPARRLDSVAGEIAEIGLRIVKVQDWAPYTGWLEAASGDVETALLLVDEVHRRVGAEAVEPEMLTVKR